MPDLSMNVTIVILGVVLALILFDAALALLAYQKQICAAAAMQPEDVSELVVEPPEVLLPAAETLRRLGFQRVGEAGRPELAAVAGPAQVWYFADHHATTCAGLFTGQGRAVVVFYSWFAERAVIVTGYLTGETIESRDFRFHVVNSSIEDAYQHHQAQIPNFADHYGAPLRLDAMPLILHLDEVYNVRFAPRRLRPPLIRRLLTPLLQLALVAVLIGAILAIRFFDQPTGPVLAATVVLMVGMGLIALLLRTRR